MWQASKPDSAHAADLKAAAINPMFPQAPGTRGVILRHGNHSFHEDQKLNLTGCRAHRRCPHWWIGPQNSHGSRNTFRPHQAAISTWPIEIPFLVMDDHCPRSVARAGVAISKSIEAQSRLRVFTNNFPGSSCPNVQHRPTRSIDPTACINIVVGLWRIEPAPSYPMQLDRKSDI